MTLGKSHVGDEVLPHEGGELWFAPCALKDSWKRIFFPPKCLSIFIYLFIYLFILQNKIHIFKHSYIHTDYYIMDLKQIK